MATYTVDTTADTIDAGDGVLSLREALVLANLDPTTADKIDFDSSVQGQTIVLAGSQLTVAPFADVTIDGGIGVTIDADGKSRVLLVQDGNEFGSTDVSLQHLTITGGRAMEADTEHGYGGGIAAGGYTFLALDHCAVSGNSTAGRGGGIYGGVTLTDSTVSGNSTTGGNGGGIWGYIQVGLTNSTVSGISAAGDGGGIYCAHDVGLTNSTVSGNSTAGDNAGGGGIYGGDVTLTNSTVSGNSTAGDNAGGGLRPVDH